MARGTLVAALVMGGVAGLALGISVLFAGGPPPAPPRPTLAVASEPTGVEIKFSATLFRGLVEQDAKAMAVAAPSVDEWRRPFPYFNELTRPRFVRPGSPVRTPHLGIDLVVRREQGAVEGQSFRADHLVLKIENSSSQHLAYRLSTRVSDAGRCDAKGVIAHNAVALRPHETIYRTECLLQKESAVEITRVEVMEIPPLAYAYVSRLMPGLALYDGRVSAGHTIPRGPPCPQTFSWRDLRDGAARGEIAWRDIIDFYARHNCAEYGFFPGYRYRTDADAPLPARPPG